MNKFKLTLLLLFSILLIFFFSNIILANHSEDKITDSLYDAMHQTSYESKPIKVWIEFTDKDLSSNYIIRRNKKLTERLKKAGITGFRNEEIPVNQQYIKILQDLKIRPVVVSNWMNAVSAVLPAKKIYELESLDFIKRIDVVRTYRDRPSVDIALTSGKMNGDPPSVHQKSPKYGYSDDQLQELNFPVADELGFSGRNVRICILDTGFNTNHESLRYSRILSTYDFVSVDNNVNLQEHDPYGSADHGTAVLSLLTGFMPGKLIGPAYGADYILARTEDIASSECISEDIWISAVEWADSVGANIVLSSTGLIFDQLFEDSSMNENDVRDSYIYKIVKTAAERGILFVASAPPQYNDSKMFELKKAGLDILFTASGNDVFENNDIFNSIGEPSSDVSLAIKSSMSDLYTAEGGGDNFYGWKKGSSYLAALAAASAALIIEAHPDWNALQILDSLRNSSDENQKSEDKKDKKNFIDIFSSMNFVFKNGSGDLDGNGRIDGNDLAIFCSIYLNSEKDRGGKKSADLDGNMIIDGEDLAIFVSRFLSD